MKRVSKLFALLIAALSVALVSCNKDGSSDNFYVSYGVIVGTQDAYTIKTDGGNTLTVIENLVPLFPVVDGMRVRVNYTIEKQTANGFEVRLNAIEKILSKDPVYSTKLTPEELLSVGIPAVFDLCNVPAAGSNSPEEVAAILSGFGFPVNEEVAGKTVLPTISITPFVALMQQVASDCNNDFKLTITDKAGQTTIATLQLYVHPLP